MLCLVLVLPGFVLFLASIATDRLPSDSNMIRHFYEHEEEFKAIFEKVDEWPDNTLNLDWEQRHSSYVPALDETQIEEMRERFKRLGINRVSVDQKRINDALTVYINSYDSSYNFGEQKGYAYLANPPRQMIYDENLNKMNVDHGKLVFRHVEGNWFLYLQGPESD